MLCNAHAHVYSPEQGDFKMIVLSLPDETGFINDLHQKDCLVSMGIHPWQSEKSGDAPGLNELEQLLTRYPRLQMGECGLDYACNIDRMIQQKVFKAQIELALKYDRVMSIHCVRAWGDLVSALKSYSSLKGLIHGYRGSFETAQVLTKMGLYLSFSATGLKFQPQKSEVFFQRIPQDKILIESDEAENLIETADLLSAYLKMSRFQLIEITNQNFLRLFAQATRGA
jgi:TatD DNase family protein